MLATLIATFFGSGFSPIAPGTAGSLAAWACFYFGLGHLAWPMQIAAIVGLYPIAHWAVTKWESRSGHHDDGKIVIDEVMGMWIAVAGFPPSLLLTLIGFALFRLMDVWKPWPADQIDHKWPGARGVIFDDIVAGIYAHALLRLLVHLESLL